MLPRCGPQGKQIFASQTLIIQTADSVRNSEYGLPKNEVREKPDQKLVFA
jgi:hypothetical protein